VLGSLGSALAGARLNAIAGEGAVALTIPIGSAVGAAAWRGAETTGTGSVALRRHPESKS